MVCFSFMCDPPQKRNLLVLHTHFSFYIVQPSLIKSLSLYLYCRHSSRWIFPQILHFCISVSFQFGCVIVGTILASSLLTGSHHTRLASWRTNFVDAFRYSLYVCKIVRFIWEQIFPYHLLCVICFFVLTYVILFRKGSISCMCV